MMCLVYPLPDRLCLVYVVAFSAEQGRMCRHVSENFMRNRRVYQAKVQQQLAVGFGLAQAPPPVAAAASPNHARGGRVLGGWEDDDEDGEETEGERGAVREPGSVTGMKYAPGLTPPQANNKPDVSDLPQVDLDKAFAVASPPRSDHHDDQQRQRQQQQQQRHYPAPAPLDMGDIDKAFDGAFEEDPQVVESGFPHPSIPF